MLLDADNNSEEFDLGQGHAAHHAIEAFRQRHADPLLLDELMELFADRRRTLARDDPQTLIQRQAGLHAAHDDVDAVGIRMNAVALIQFGVRSHSPKKERIKDDRVSRGKRRIDGVEIARVVGPEVPRRLHAGEQHGDATVGKPSQDCIERRFRYLRVEATQRIVGPELQNDGIGPFRNGPLKPGETARRRVARYSGVRDCGGNAFCVERPF